MLASHLCLSNAAADVTFYPGPVPVILISGNIKKGDFVAVQSLAKPNTRLFVQLNSQGGEVDEAIRIGRLIREKEATVFVQEKNTCVSACVFILAGGVQRSVAGKVGIHRPYLEIDMAKTDAEQKYNYAKIEADIKSYLKEVNIPSSLYDQMLRISPDRVRYLNATELQDTGLGEDDPYYREALDSRLAESQGLTKRQWIAVQASCLKNGPNPNYESCKQQVLKKESARN